MIAASAYYFLAVVGLIVVFRLIIALAAHERWTRKQAKHGGVIDLTERRKR